MNGNVEYISCNEKYGIARNKSGSGNLSEPSSNCFLDENSDKSALCQNNWVSRSFGATRLLSEKVQKYSVFVLPVRAYGILLELFERGRKVS